MNFLGMAYTSIGIEARPWSYPGLFCFLHLLHLFLPLKHTKHLGTPYCCHPAQATVVFAWLIITASSPCSLFPYVPTVCTHSTMMEIISKQESGCFIHSILTVGWLPASPERASSSSQVPMLLHLRSFADFLFEKCISTGPCLSHRPSALSLPISRISLHVFCKPWDDGSCNAHFRFPFEFTHFCLRKLVAIRDACLLV